MVVHQRRIGRDGGLRDCRDPKGSGSQGEGSDKTAAIHRAVGAKLCRGMDDRHMWRVKQRVVAQHLGHPGCPVRLLNANSVIKLKTAGAAAFGIVTGIA